MIDNTAPVAYLTQDPTPEETVLAEQVGQHLGAPVPFWMFARLALKQWGVSAWAASRRKMERRLRRWVIAGASIAATNLGGLFVFLYHRADAMAEQQRAVGAEQERAAELARDVQRYRDATEETIRELRLDIRELRAAMRKMTGVDPEGAHSGDLLRIPSAFSLVIPFLSPSTMTPGPMCRSHSLMSPAS